MGLRHRSQGMEHSHRNLEIISLVSKIISKENYNQKKKKAFCTLSLQQPLKANKIIIHLSPKNILVTLNHHICLKELQHLNICNVLRHPLQKQNRTIESHLPCILEERQLKQNQKQQQLAIKILV